MPIDEKARRRPEFADGIAVRLADGQEWTLPRPVIELEPAFGDDGKAVGLVRRRSFGTAYDDLLEEFLKTDGGEAELFALIDLAADLLGRNYLLSPAEVAPLLRYRPDDEANRAMWQAIADVAQGNTADPPMPAGGA